ncbi:hypothetical protein FQA39_LY17846 [Lamprigera yunnana]|nr:hypothetical protein FQA39_LY17846 [Lamprigera yunnana]
MKPSTSSKVGNVPKSKKSSKDREKRKSQTSVENTTLQNSEKGSPNKDNCLRKFAGYGVEEINAIAEYSLNEHLTDEVSLAFTEDINYKLRHIIYEALIKARLCSRNHITASDIDDTFDCLQINRVYGCETNPSWISLSDQNIYYLDDTKVHLIDLAEELLECVQPNESYLIRKWLPENKEVSGALQHYFIVMCEAIVDKDEKIYQTALESIKTNRNIGPIIEWFYHFGYLLLSKDITYDSLTLRALELIRALELNPTSSFIVSDKQIMLLSRLLLQRLLRIITNSDLLKPMCQLLALLCRRIPTRVMILKKMVTKFPEVRDVFALPICCAVNYLGLDAMGAILIPHLQFLFAATEMQAEPNFILELLRSYNIICIEDQNTNSIYDEFYNCFGEAIIPYLKYPRRQLPEDQQKQDYWYYSKSQLIKSRRKIPPREKKKYIKIHIEEAFPEEEEDPIIKTDIFDYKFETKPTIDELNVPLIRFKFQMFAPAIGRLRFLKLATFNQVQTETQVLVGKRMLLSPIFNKFKTPRTCINHTLMYHNL